MYLFRATLCFYNHEVVSQCEFRPVCRFYEYYGYSRREKGRERGKTERQRVSRWMCFKLIVLMY